MQHRAKHITRACGGRFLALGTGGFLLFAGVQNASALTPAAETNATNLVNNLLGPGVSLVGTPTLVSGFTVSGQVASGTFTGGNASGLGFNTGIVLMSGRITEIDGPNSKANETLGTGGSGTGAVLPSFGHAAPGDAQLTALAGAPTFDAAALTFQFQFGDGSVGGNLFFNYVFGSEEYLDYVGSAFNDVFGFFLDGQNIALLPVAGSPPVTINNVNPNANPGFYRNNVTNTNGVPSLGLDTQLDGITTVLQASKMNLGPGVHTIKLAVGDTTDGILDAAVFIEAGSFSVIPEPSALAGIGLAALTLLRRRSH
jgi:hypothetical protein